MDDIINNQYRIDLKLGSGGFSEVYLATDIQSDKKVAIKKIILNESDSKKAMLFLDKVHSEIEAMKILKHPNIVGYLDTIVGKNVWYIIMEYCDAGTFDDVIKYCQEMTESKNPQFDREAVVYYYMNQLREALIYLNELGYAHRDIKSANILLKKSIGDNENNQKGYSIDKKLIVKVADFGLIKNLNGISLDELNPMKTICGSPLFMAPELMLGHTYNSKADLWSTGVIMYQLLFGEYPHDASSIKQLVENVKTKNINFHLNKDYTSPCFDILVKLLDKDPRKRIDWEDFFNHEWFKKWKKGYFNDRRNTSPMNSLCITNRSKPIATPLMTPTTYIYSSSLGESNLSRMKSFEYLRNYKPGSYADYSASYPLVEKNKNISDSKSNNLTDIDYWRQNNSIELSKSNLRNRIFSTSLTKSTLNLESRKSTPSSTSGDLSLSSIIVPD